MSFSTALEFIFYGWAIGFAFAVSWHYAAKVFFSPKGIFSFWSGPH